MVRGGNIYAIHHTRRSVVSPYRDGYVLTDALVATMILASSLIFSLQALSSAGSTARVAQELREAQSLAEGLLQRPVESLSVERGQAGRFRWEAEVAATGAEEPVAICRRAVRLQGVESGRRFEAASLLTCPKAGP